MERKLTPLLIEYDELETAWPKSRDVLIRARAGRQVADALARDCRHRLRLREGHDAGFRIA